MRRRVLVAILNWHSAEATVECIAAVRSSQGVDLEILVIDNGSTDTSPDHLRRALTSLSSTSSPPAQLLLLDRNTGYAGGMNAALEWVRGGGGAGLDYLLFLTPDAVVGRETIVELVGALEGDPGAGVAGPVVVYRGGPDRLVGAGGYIDPRRVRTGLYRGVRGAAPYPVDWIDGCCMLVRPEVVGGLGGFDERYFLYFEETDLCSRVVRGGWRILLVPGSEVFHEKLGSPPSYYYYYMSRNRYLFWRESHGVGVFRVGLSLGLEVLGLVVSWVLSVLVPSRWGRLGDDGVRLVRKVGGVVRGSADYARGRFGAMGSR